MTVLLSTLSQMGFLFSLIAIGYFLAKRKLVPYSTAGSLSKLENLLFIPALALGTFAEHFTVERLSTAWIILLAGFIVVGLGIPLSIWVSRRCAKDTYTQRIFTYGLSFSNFGFMGNSVVQALFPDVFLEYLLFTLPFWILIYLWGVPALLIGSEEKPRSLKERLKPLANPMIGGMLIGMVIGLSGLKMPGWMDSVVDTCSSCMSPIAMLLSGMTVANIDLKKTFVRKDLYAISLVRLLVFPVLGLIFFALVPMPQEIVICSMVALSMPLGLNTIVVPSAYGRDTTAAAGMALISHILSVATIPAVFMVLSLILQ